MEFFTPKLFIVSAPSGTGKTSIIANTRTIFPRLILSISYTTRVQRSGEQDKVDYFFISKEKFKTLIDTNEFLEWASVHDNFYGTSRQFIESIQQAGNIVILDIDVQGATQVREHSDLDTISIFIIPPSLTELRHRLEKRGTESQQSIETRLINAKHELSFQNQYDYVMMNKDLNIASNNFLEIVLKECIDSQKIKDEKIDDILSKLIPKDLFANNHQQYIISSQILKNIIPNI